MSKPTVSQLIDLLNKPALMKWANKIGLEGVRLEDYKKKSSENGDNIHKQIENDFRYGITFNDPQFQAFKSRYKFVDAEPVIECDHYRGRADVILERDGLRYLFDFKNSNSVYFEQKLQLIAYKRVLKVDMIGIVNTTYFTENFISVTEEQEKQYVKILSALVVIWNAKQIIE